MRTIEFRGKRIDGEGWVYGYVDATMYKDIVVIHTETGTFGVDPETVGQFTGLYDKNDNEIYEGDIVSIEAINKVVEWNSERACWDAGGENRIELYAFYYCEVIGNIHDNRNY